MDRGDSSLGDGWGSCIGYPLVQPHAVVAYAADDDDPLLPIGNAASNGACAVVGDLGSGKTFRPFRAYGPTGGSGKRRK